MGSDSSHSSAENTQSAVPKNVQPNFSAQDQKFGIFEKIYFWVSVVHGLAYAFVSFMIYVHSHTYTYPPILGSS